MKLSRLAYAVAVLGTLAALWVGGIAFVVAAIWIAATTSWPDWVLSAVGIAGFGYLAWKADKLRAKIQDEDMTRKITEEDIYGAPEWPER